MIKHIEGEINVLFFWMEINIFLLISAYIKHSLNKNSINKSIICFLISDKKRYNILIFRLTLYFYQSWFKSCVMERQFYYCSLNLYRKCFLFYIRIYKLHVLRIKKIPRLFTYRSYNRDYICISYCTFTHSLPNYTQCLISEYRSKITLWNASNKTITIRYWFLKLQTFIRGLYTFATTHSSTLST